MAKLKKKQSLVSGLMVINNEALDSGVKVLVRIYIIRLAKYCVRCAVCHINPLAQEFSLKF